MKKIAFVDIRMSEEEKLTLSSVSDKIIPLPPHPRISPQVASHPDMLIFPVKDAVIVRSEYLHIYPEVREKILSAGIKIIESKNSAQTDYPFDIAMNAVKVGDILISNIPHTDERIIAMMESNGVVCVNVHQGYASCSTVVLDSNHIITADAGIATAAKKHGIEVLLSKEGHISLDGYEYGFIGGACGTYEKMLITCGDIRTHPSGNDIISLCNKLGMSILSLCNDTLRDRGKIFIIKTGG